MSTAFQSNAFQGDAFQIGAPQTGPVDVSKYGWQQRLSEPVRTRVLPVAVIAASGFFGPQLPTVSFSWFNGLSEPVRTAPRLVTGAQQFFATDTDPIVSFSWFEGLSEPVRKKPRLLEASQRFFEFNPQPITPSMGWFNALSEPVRAKARLIEGAQQAFAWTPITITPAFDYISWFNALSEPVRLRPRLPEALQRFTEFSPFPITPSTDWFNALSEPVRGKARAQPQQNLAWTPINITPVVFADYGWYQAFSEPVRRKPALIAAAQSFIARSTQPFVSFGWNRPDTNLPPRAKPGLPAQLQMAFTMPPRIVTPSMGWFEAWTERQAAPPKGLQAWLQQASIWTPVPLTTPAITGIWFSTETKDTFLAGGTMFEAPLEAIVGVIEVAFQGLSGVIQVRDTGSPVALPVDPAAGSGGAAVTVIASANVSIRVT